MIIIILHDTDKLHFSLNFFFRSRICLFNLCYADNEFCFNLFWCCVCFRARTKLSRENHISEYILIHNFLFTLHAWMSLLLHQIIPHKNLRLFLCTRLIFRLYSFLRMGEANEVTFLSFLLLLYFFLLKHQSNPFWLYAAFFVLHVNTTREMM